MEQDIHIRFKLTNEHVTLCKVVNIKKRLFSSDVFFEFHKKDSHAH